MVVRSAAEKTGEALMVSSGRGGEVLAQVNEPPKPDRIKDTLPRDFIYHLGTL